jgi:hypothetical protein
VQIDALNRFSVELYPWKTLPVNPLKLLTPDQRKGVFDLRDGQEKRLLRLFHYLPNIVIPRDVVLTVCAQRSDPMRRVRAIKKAALDMGIELLVGTWLTDNARAQDLGFDLAGEAWVGVHRTGPDTSRADSASRGAEPDPHLF